MNLALTHLADKQTCAQPLFLAPQLLSYPKVVWPESQLVKGQEHNDIINLSSYPLSENEAKVLKLGPTFCPDQEADQCARYLMYKVLYDKGPMDIEIPTFDNSVLGKTNMEDLRALQDLMEVWDKSNPEEEGDVATISGQTPDIPLLPNVHDHFPPKSYKPKSKSFPILQGNSNIWAFVIQVYKAIEATNWKLGPHLNLPLLLRQTIKFLRTNKHKMIKPSDKGSTLSL